MSGGLWHTWFINIEYFQRTKCTLDKKLLEFNLAELAKNKRKDHYSLERSRWLIYLNKAVNDIQLGWIENCISSLCRWFRNWVVWWKIRVKNVWTVSGIVLFYLYSFVVHDSSTTSRSGSERRVGPGRPRMSLYISRPDPDVSRPKINESNRIVCGERSQCLDLVQYL